MRLRRTLIISSLTAVAGLAGGGIAISGIGASGGAALGSVPPPPPPPPWVRANGTVETSRMPAAVPLLGTDGQPLRNRAGRIVMVAPGGGPPPALSSLPLAARRNSTSTPVAKPAPNS